MLRRTPGPPRKGGWLLLIKHAVRVKLGEVRNGPMKRLWFVMLVTLAMGSVRIPAQQTPPAAGSSQPAGKPPPQARTQPEFKDYHPPYALTRGAGMEKAAHRFSTQYPS